MPKNNNSIQDELRAWNSPLAAAARDMPFSLPENYFESLPTGLLTVAQSAMPHISCSPVFAIPDNYFQSFPEKMLAIAQKENAAEQAEQHLPKGMPFAVPSGYFDQLHGRIAATAHNQYPSKTHVLPRGRFLTWKSMRLAVAAVLILGFGFSMYYYMQAGKIMGAANTTAEIQQISEGLISDYIQFNIDDFDTDMIENHLLANASLPAELSMDKLDDNDIIQYLDETGWGGQHDFLSTKF
jgi:hypothetical protein